MDARFSRAALVAALLAFSMGASHRTANFVVQAPTPQLAAQIGAEAERFREELALSWLGHTLPRWSSPCVMTVRIGANLGAGGATTFMFRGGEVFGWRMNIQGSQERVLDSVLPHEITHMVLASHFRCPLPRWADEGAATSVEHESERAKHRRMLEQFLRTNRGIPFNTMFALREYPRDVLPLYAQGYSLAEYLIQKNGRRAFVAYVEEGLRTKDWDRATSNHYQMANLGKLQTTWLAYVEQNLPSSPRVTPTNGPPLVPSTTPDVASPAVLVADARLRPRPEPNLIRHEPANEKAVDRIITVPLVPVNHVERSAVAFRPGSTGGVQPLIASPYPSWRDRNADVASAGVILASHVEETSTPSSTVSTEMARPQSLEPSRQTVLEWRR